MMTLIILTMVGSAFGGLGGAAAIGRDGLILGGSIGFIIGATVWTVASMIIQWQHERRLNHYFVESNRREHNTLK
jgi:hypothetical protein